MFRERATEVQDLPHQFEAASADICRICHGAEQDARHLAWERAAVELASSDVLPRERGI